MECDIYFYEVYKEEEELLKKDLPMGIEAGFNYHTIQEIFEKEKICEPKAKIISIRTQSAVPRNWIDDGKISAVISRTTGYDHLKDFEDKIRLGYLPDYSRRAVAEQAIMFYFVLARKLIKQMEHFKDFNRNNLSGFEAKNKNILIVGVGRIGSEICRIAKGLGMEVFGVDRERKYKNVRYVGIDEGLKKADVIICAMSLNEKNKKYFNYEVLKKARKGVFFINVSRGELSPSADLLKLVKENHLGGLALDVYNEEYNLVKSLRTGRLGDGESKAVLELSKFDNVILTPHNAFNTHESTKRKAEQTIENLNYFLKTGKMKWEVPRD